VSAKYPSRSVLLPGLDLGKHGIGKHSHRQTKVSHMPVVRSPPSAQTWINHRLHPPLSGHSARSLGHFKRYAQVLCQCWHSDAAFPYCGLQGGHVHFRYVGMVVQTQQERLVIEGFIDILQLCINVALICLDDTDFPRDGANMTSPRV
jgi:hypothetical protein